MDVVVACVVVDGGVTDVGVVDAGGAVVEAAGSNGCWLLSFVGVGRATASAAEILVKDEGPGRGPMEAIFPDSTKAFNLLSTASGSTLPPPLLMVNLSLTLPAAMEFTWIKLASICKMELKLTATCCLVDALVGFVTSAMSISKLNSADASATNSSFTDGGSWVGGDCLP